MTTPSPSANKLNLSPDKRVPHGQEEAFACRVDPAGSCIEYFKEGEKWPFLRELSIPNDKQEWNPDRLYAQIELDPQQEDGNKISVTSFFNRQPVATHKFEPRWIHTPRQSIQDKDSQFFNVDLPENIEVINPPSFPSQTNIPQEFDITTEDGIERFSFSRGILETHYTFDQKGNQLSIFQVGGSVKSSHWGSSYKSQECGYCYSEGKAETITKADGQNGYVYTYFHENGRPQETGKAHSFIRDDSILTKDILTGEIIQYDPAGNITGYINADENGYPRSGSWHYRELSPDKNGDPLYSVVIYEEDGSMYEYHSKEPIDNTVSLQEEAEKICTTQAQENKVLPEAIAKFCETGNVEYKVLPHPKYPGAYLQHAKHRPVDMSEDMTSRPGQQRPVPGSFPFNAARQQPRKFDSMKP